MSDSLQRVLCNMQGRLFEESADLNYDSISFIEAFMKSDIALDLDSTFNFMQWAGKEYILERMQDELKDKLKKSNNIYDIYNKDVLYWIGYVYRYWHYYKNETSKEIYKQAPVKTMLAVYYSYHTLSVELAIERLKDTYIDKKRK